MMRVSVYFIRKPSLKFVGLPVLKIWLISVTALSDLVTLTFDFRPWIGVTGVFYVAVRPYHPTPPTTTLAEGAGASRVQASRPCLQASAADSAIVPLRRTMPAGRI